MRNARVFVLGLGLAMGLAGIAEAQQRGNMTEEERARRRAEQAQQLQEELQSPSPIEALNSVWIEELTWMEVRDAIVAGKTTAIISTGGIEQNGPYVATGKHNYILQSACEWIARDLGNALCAPILKFVPEGNIEEPSGHMRQAAVADSGGSGWLAMIAGHFGLAAAVKAKEPQIPLWSLMLSTQWLDVVFVPLFVTGIESMEPGRAVSPVTALVTYVVVTPILMWGAYLVSGTFDLPGWFFPLAIGLGAVGLPIVITTAIVQARGQIHFADGPGVEDPDPTPTEEERLEKARPPTEVESWSGVKSLFTWRNTVGGGVMVTALWVVLVLGWILLWRQSATP